MNRILRRLSPLLLFFVSCGLFRITHAADEQPPAASPAELLKIWKDYGLPLPPPEAPLVRFTTGIRSVFPDKEKWRYEEKLHYGIGFLLKPVAGEEPAVILSGSTEFWQERSAVKPEAVKLEEIKPAAASFTGILVKTELDINGPNSLLGVALQCEARGWTEFAVVLLKEALAQDTGHHASMVYQRANTSGVDAVHIAVWSFLRSEAMRPGADRVSIAARMKRLLDTGHGLWRGDQRLYEATVAAAQPGKSQPGTPEALIDKLIDSRGVDRTSVSRHATANDPYYQLEALGFSAVPALMEHLNDTRLTCSMMAAADNSPEWPRSICHLVADLLQSLAGDELGSDWLDGQGDGVPADKAVRDWWERAKATGEEMYLVRNSIARSNEDGAFPNECHLRILRARYPQRLADVLHTQMKERPKAQIHPVLTAIEESSLPEAEKTALFGETVGQANPETRRVGLFHLCKHNPVLFRTETVKAFDAITVESSADFCGSPEANLSHLALRTDDAAVWAAFLHAAKRATPSLRMALMNPFNYSYVGEDFLSQRLHFLRAFLDDTAPRELPIAPEGRKKLNGGGPRAAAAVPGARVCDLAALKIASILKWPDRPDEKWSKKQWEDLRTRVKKAPEITRP
jgi:hypothetical protein